MTGIDGADQPQRDSETDSSGSCALTSPVFARLWFFACCSQSDGERERLRDASDSGIIDNIRMNAKI